MFEKKKINVHKLFVSEDNLNQYEFDLDSFLRFTRLNFNRFTTSLLQNINY